MAFLKHRRAFADAPTPKSLGLKLRSVSRLQGGPPVTSLPCGGTWLSSVTCKQKAQQTCQGRGAGPQGRRAMGTPSSGGSSRQTRPQA